MDGIVSFLFFYKDNIIKSAKIDTFLKPKEMKYWVVF